MARIINRAQGLSGLNPLAYMGVQGAQNNNTIVPFVSFNIDPTPQDWQNFSLGTIWLRADTQKAWMLVNLDSNVAKWVEFTAGSGSILGIINTDGNLGITTVGQIATVNFSPSITVQRNIIGVNGVISMNNDGTSSEPVGVIGLNQTSNDVVGGHIQITKQHGTGNPIVSGDVVGNYSWYGFDGTNYVETARITSVSSGTVAPFRVAGDLEFWTHADSSSSPNLTGTQRAVISSAGNVTINAPDSGVALNSISTYGQSVGTTQSFVVVDNTGKFGTAPGGFSTGSFTPTIIFSTVQGTITYTLQVAKYTQIANMVFYDLNVTFSSIGTSSGNASVGGFPIAAGVLSVDGTFQSNYITLGAGNTQQWCNIANGAVRASLIQGGSGIASTALTDANFTGVNPWTVVLVGFYYTS